MKLKMKPNAEIAMFGIFNIILLVIIVLVYKLSTRLPALLLFIIFLLGGIFHSYKMRFEESNLFLSEKGRKMMFMKSCIPYVLQTVFFAQLSLLIGWILLHMK